MIIRYPLLVTAVAPLVLAWIVIDRPGTPPGEISVSCGWWIGLAGGLLILVGSVRRARESAARKPPGLP